MIQIEVPEGGNTYPNNVRFVAVYITSEQNYNTFEDVGALDRWLEENKEDIKIGNIVNLVIFEVSGVKEIPK